MSPVWCNGDDQFLPTMIKLYTTSLHLATVLLCCYNFLYIHTWQDGRCVSLIYRPPNDSGCSNIVILSYLFFIIRVDMTDGEDEQEKT